MTNYDFSKPYDLYINSQTMSNSYTLSIPRKLFSCLKEKSRNNFIEILKSGKVGFLGMNLDRSSAQAYLYCARYLEFSDIFITAAKYRYFTCIDDEYALGLAKVALKDKISKHYKKETIDSDLKILSKNYMNYCFGYASKSLEKKGITPNLITVEVDVLDGHIWTEAEKNFYELLNNEYEFKIANEKYNLSIPKKFIVDRTDSFVLV